MFAICGPNGVFFDTSASAATQPSCEAIFWYSPSSTVFPTPRKPVTTSDCSV